MEKSVEVEAIDLKRASSSRFVKITFGVMALASLALGLLVISFSDPHRIPHDTARPMAVGFLYAAIACTAVLFIWDRIFKRHG
jgi:hypothetical protein